MIFQPERKTNIKTIDSYIYAQDLIEMLVELSKQKKYVFRGQRDARWLLFPYAFRNDAISYFREKFPVSQDKINQWFIKEKTREQVKLHFPQYQYNSMQKCHLYIKNLFDFTVYVMQYNYSVKDYFKKHPLHIDTDDHITNLWPEGFWNTEDTFDWLIGNTLNMIPTIIAGGEITSEGSVEEQFTGMPEYFPQHYGVPTAALDWTYNPVIALYFAMHHDKSKYFNTQNNLYVKPPPQYLAIYVHEELPGDNDSLKITLDKHVPSNHVRQKKQEGVFTYFNCASSFYLLHGKFPSIENFPSYHSKRIKKYVLECNDSNLQYIQYFLKDRGITREYLFSD